MSGSTSSPVKKSQRIHELDILRGFAILGVFMVNILVMNVSFVYRADWEAEQVGWLQQGIFFMLEILFYNKFFSIFSLLFGMGVALQVIRAKAKDSFSLPFFLRRFGSLFFFGILHILFLWAGDILHIFGMLGFLLLVFVSFRPQVILWSALLIFFFPFYSEIFDQTILWLELDHASPIAALSREEIIELKHNGSYWSGVILRIKEYGFVMPFIYAGIVPVAFTMMLLGAYIVKKGLLEEIPHLLKRSARPLFVSLTVLLIYRFILLYMVIPNFQPADGSFASISLTTIYQLSDMAIALALVWLVAKLWQFPQTSKLLYPLTFVGRLAFSNYILQSLIGYWIMRSFNGYEYFSPFQCVLMVLAIFTLQILLSKWWLKHFRFGPLEWLWRCISYWKVLPFKIKA